MCILLVASSVNPAGNLSSKVSGRYRFATVYLNVIVPDCENVQISGYTIDGTFQQYVVSSWFITVCIYVLKRTGFLRPLRHSDP